MTKKKSPIPKTKTEMEAMMELPIFQEQTWKRIWRLAQKPKEKHEQIYKYVIKLLKTCPKVIFLSQIYGILGLTKSAFFKYIYSSADRQDEINCMLRRNRSMEAISTLIKLEKCNNPAALIVRLKLSSEEARHILRDKEGTDEPKKVLSKEEKEKAIKDLAKELFKDHPKLGGE